MRNHLETNLESELHKMKRKEWIKKKPKSSNAPPTSHNPIHQGTIRPLHPIPEILE
jgi:hypothetical protein